MNERRVGAYGICRRGDALLAIAKKRGPYRNLWDLPGGAPLAGESLKAALGREVREETGLAVAVGTEAGRREFVVPWPAGDSTHLHHKAFFYIIQPVGGRLQATNRPQKPNRKNV